MATLFSDGRGNRQIQFTGSDGKRRSLRLGRITKRGAEAIKLRVELLNSAALAQVAVDNDTALWVASLDRVLYAKLARVGLVTKRSEPQRALLAGFVDAYIASRSDLKPTTKEHLKRARANLVDYFGADRPLAEITPGHADEFRRHLQSTMAESTANRTCGRAKQFFRAALRKKLIAESPFADMQGVSVKPNRARDYFITRDVASRVLEACPDNEWRLLFALSRYGGLRCPSEHVLLRWSDVDWQRGRLMIRSPKTEHHEGKECRLIPLFPELRPYLESARQESETGAEFVIASRRSATTNLRTQLERIIRKAGLEPWPKLFQNLRATRETELAESYPLHVVCEWIGNSQIVAARHYLQVTDAHFKKATENAAPGGAAPSCTEVHGAEINEG